MKNLILIISILISLISCSNNDQTNFESGNLWKITSKNGTESYIFSTIHLYPKDELEISSKAVSVLKKCNTLALEFNMLDSLERQKFNEFEIPKSLSNGYSALITEYAPEELSSMEIQLIEIAQKNELSTAILAIRKNMRRFAGLAQENDLWTTILLNPNGRFRNESAHSPPEKGKKTHFCHKSVI